MKIAVPTRENFVDDHFGHCAYYTIFEIENNKITNRSTLPAPQGCGCKSGVAAILQAEGVSLMLAGNMGEGAKNVLEYPAFYLQPEIENIKKEVSELGAAASMMSGSGATVFGIFRKKDEEKAFAAKELFEERGWFTYICDFENFN